MPPKPPAKNQTRIIYPPGVKDITEDLCTDDLVRRLKACAQAFQSMGQDDNNQDYIPLAMHLAHDIFLEHSSKDVRLLIACCIADVFRVYAPDAPYKDPDHLKIIFLFLIKQLRGLEDPKDPAFKRYFYLLENLAWVKSFNICIELEDNQEIFCQLFTLMFTIVNDDHSNKVKNFMLDMMSPLISEADSVSQELLDVILSNIIEPRKSQNRNAYNLARDLLKRTASTIEPYIQSFFNNALILGKTSESDVATNLYELIYELNSVSPSVLLAVLPQLEFKLKSNDEKERLDVTRLLARMFSDKDSELAIHHKALWNCFLGRFNDISVSVRTRCVQYSMHFLLNHPELRKDITEQLKLRQHDPEETVRYEVVMAIVSAAKKDFTSISDDLLDFVKERTLDKKFKIRKEALLGLSMIYKKCMTNPDIPESTKECVSWIKNKVLHVYYQTALEDRLLVERILHTCLVPYQLPTKERMRKLYQLYSTVDDHAVKAFNELLKCQNIVRNHVRAMLEHLNEDRSDEREKSMGQKILVLSKSLPDPVKTQEFLKKFVSILRADTRLKAHMDTIMKPDCTCKEAEESVREVLKKLGNPVMTNVFYMTVKQMLERVAPVLIDREAVYEIVVLTTEALKGECSLEDVGPLAAERGLKLLLTLSIVFPGSFQCEDIYTQLIDYLKQEDETAAEITLQIFGNIGSNIEDNHPHIAIQLLPLLQNYSQNVTVKHSKHAIRCMMTICNDKELVFRHTLEELKKNLTLESPKYRTSLVAIGHIAYHCPDLFIHEMKAIVSKVIVKELLMQDKDITRDNTEHWCEEDALSEETKAKIEGMKLMVRWLTGLKNSVHSGISTLRLLTTVIMHDGDLMERQNISRAEMAWLRLTAGCCLLKISQEPVYSELLTPEQYITMALLLNDLCYQVRERFAQKLHKGLIALKLPLEFMAIFSLGGNEPTRELKSQLKQFLLANINKRRDYLKQQPVNSNEKILSYLPDYVLPYAIHLLAHDPDFKKFDNVKALQQIRECLWFLLEPLITKNENYSFSFFKRLLENIKQTKDAQSPNDEVQNMKLYAVCDLALGLILSKTTSFVLVEFPVEPTLPKKLFTEMDRNFVNTKTYLPPEMSFTPPKNSGIEMEMYKAPKPHHATREHHHHTTRGRGRGRGHMLKRQTNGNMKDDSNGSAKDTSNGSEEALAKSRAEQSLLMEGFEQDDTVVTSSSVTFSSNTSEQMETESSVQPENIGAENEVIAEIVECNDEEEDEEEKNKKQEEKSEFSNLRTRHIPKDSDNRKDDDSHRRGPGRPAGSRNAATRSQQSTKTSDNRNTNESKDSSDKNSNSSQEQQSKDTKESGNKRPVRDKSSLQDNSENEKHEQNRIMTRRSSVADMPRKRPPSSPRSDNDTFPKRLRSSNQDGKNTVKSNVSKPLRPETKGSPGKKPSNSTPNSPNKQPAVVRKPLTRQGQTTDTKSRDFPKKMAGRGSPLKKTTTPQKLAVPIGKRNIRRTSMSNGLDRTLNSDGEESENSTSPRKSSRILAKTEEAERINRRRVNKRGRR